MRKIILFSLFLIILNVSLALAVVEDDFEKFSKEGIGLEVPSPASLILSNQKINFYVTDEKNGEFIFNVVLEGNIVSSVEKGKLDKPTINMYTKESVFVAIAGAKDPLLKFNEAIDNGEIKYYGATIKNKVKLTLLSIVIEIKKLFTGNKPDKIEQKAKLVEDSEDNDNDGVANNNDNCLDVPNTEQLDSDADLVGNACDNCPEMLNNQQTDRDNNDVGDACQSAFKLNVKSSELKPGYGAFVDFIIEDVTVSPRELLVEVDYDNTNNLLTFTGSETLQDTRASAKVASAEDIPDYNIVVLRVYGQNNNPITEHDNQEGFGVARMFFDVSPLALSGSELSMKLKLKPYSSDNPSNNVAEDGNPVYAEPLGVSLKIV